MNAQGTHTGSGKLMRIDTAEQVAEVRYWVSIEEDPEGPGSWGGQFWATGPNAAALRDGEDEQYELIMEVGRSGRIRLGRSAGSLGGSAFGAFFTGIGEPPA